MSIYMNGCYELYYVSGGIFFCTPVSVAPRRTVTQIMPYLFAYRDDRFGFRFEIGDSALLGRSPECDLILFDRASSRQHAQIYQTENGYVLKDLGSTNGTLHNEVRVSEEITLKRNDEIRVGQEIFLFDPALEVAVGREGAVLMVGDLDQPGNNPITQPGEVDLAGLDRSALSPLYQIASALANRPNQTRVLKQAAYVTVKIFSSSRLCLLWPQAGDQSRFGALLLKPEGQRLAVPKAMVDLVIQQSRAVIWPTVLNKLDFSKGERRLDQAERTAMCVPLKAGAEQHGLLYVESGSRGYTEKDLNLLTALGQLLGNALTNAALIDQLDYRLAQEKESIVEGGDFIGNDPQITALLGITQQVAETDSRILLTGEVGTGKESLAKRVHSLSSRRSGPFISLNCSSYAPAQLESVLFGQETDAMNEEGSPGLIEMADGGTIYIRHIDHLPLASQVNLLRTLEEGVVYRIGSSTARPINIRTITSTSADLTIMVEEGEFRGDLYQRLTQVILTLPPLREIRRDIPMLANLFVSLAARDRGMDIPDLDPAVLECLTAYSWPGNVGELKNLMERLAMFAPQNKIQVEDLPPDIRNAAQAFRLEEEEVEPLLADSEKSMIRRAVARAEGSIRGAASILGISEADLSRRIRYYKIAFND